MIAPPGFDEFVVHRAQDLRRIAYLQTGNRHDADDLVQTALAKALPRWSSITRTDDPFPYVVTTLMNTRRSWWRRDKGRAITVAAPPEPSHARDPFADRDTHLDLWAALQQLPSGQRKTVVLRYYEDLSEADTALILGCSIGTVKSQCSKGIASLRVAFVKPSDTDIPEGVTL